jgi:hypothetical protein
MRPTPCWQPQACGRSRRAAFETLLVAWLAWVAWSRIAVGAHFPADVIAGFLIGWLAAWIACSSGTRWVWWCAAVAIALLDQGTKQLVEAKLGVCPSRSGDSFLQSCPCME